MTIKLKDLIKEEVLSEATLHDAVAPFFVRVIDKAFKKVKAPGKKITSRPSSFKFGSAFGELTGYSRTDLEVKANVTMFVGTGPEDVFCGLDIFRADWGAGARKLKFGWKFSDDEKKMIDVIAMAIQQAID